MTRYFTFLFILLLLCVPVFAQKAHKLKGTVKSQNDEIIAGANLYFEKDGQTNVVSTDENGEFKTELLPGDYKITVSKELSESFTTSLKIQEKGKNPKNIEFTVEANSEKPYPKLIKASPAKYAAAAMAVEATGEVIVFVEIDKDGKVLSSKAESGHPLLRSEAQKAAMNTVFESTEYAVLRQAKLTFVFLNK